MLYTSPSVSVPEVKTHVSTFDHKAPALFAVFDTQGQAYSYTDCGLHRRVRVPVF